MIYFLCVLSVWIRQFFHNAAGIAKVWDIIKWRPLPPSLLPPDHGWCTGFSDGPCAAWPVWFDNVIYRTISPNTAPEGGGGWDEDEGVLAATGKFMARMVMSTVEPLPGRMPMGIRYLHGGVHYNGGWVIFNSLAEAYSHITDPKFRRALMRFARTEQREIVVVFREKNVDPEEYANLISLIRCMLPWFSNSNGPAAPVMWGNPAPYPTINMITGAWRKDIDRLRAGDLDGIMRSRGFGSKWMLMEFHEPFGGTRTGYRWPELLLKHLTKFRIEVRGNRGNLYFIDKTKGAKK